MKKYLIYCTTWSEGEVVVREDDLLFPIGYDIQTGVTYAETLEELKKVHSFSLIETTEDIEYAASKDTALYDRHGSDSTELENYERILKNIQDRKNDSRIF